MSLVEGAARSPVSWMLLLMSSRRLGALFSKTGAGAPSEVILHCFSTASRSSYKFLKDIPHKGRRRQSFQRPCALHISDSKHSDSKHQGVQLGQYPVERGR
ncbi:hypothetical protein BKA81DRAFT_347011 [Phyllosticta paracitricarpa]